jgi:hypothetical protein
MQSQYDVAPWIGIALIMGYQDIPNIVIEFTVIMHKKYVAGQCSMCLERSLPGGDLADWLGLYPLAELVNGDKYVVEAARSFPQWANTIQPPCRKRPSCWYHLKFGSRDMYLSGKKLAILIGTDY